MLLNDTSFCPLPNVNQSQGTAEPTSVKPYVCTTLDWGCFNSYPTEKLLTAFCLSLLLCNPSALHRIADVAEDIGPSHGQVAMLRLNEEKGAAAVSALEVCP